MRKFLVLTAILLMALSFIYGCGKKESQEENKMPAEVKKAEMADSTAMDSATWDMESEDSTTMETDSM